MASWILPKNKHWDNFMYWKLSQRSFFGRIEDIILFFRIYWPLERSTIWLRFGYLSYRQATPRKVKYSHKKDSVHIAKKYTGRQGHMATWNGWFLELAGLWPAAKKLTITVIHIEFNPIPSRLCHMIYCCGYKSYLCLVGIKTFTEN